MARPRKEINASQVEELASIGCSYAEIAAVVDCDPSTLTRRFSQAIKDGHERMKASLRRAQYVSAIEKGNATMQIWLGKQYLGQTDKSQVEEVNRTLTFGNLRIPSFQSNQPGSTDKPN